MGDIKRYKSKVVLMLHFFGKKDSFEVVLPPFHLIQYFKKIGFDVLVANPNSPKIDRKEFIDFLVRNKPKSVILFYYPVLYTFLFDLLKTIKIIRKKIKNCRIGIIFYYSPIVPILFKEFRIEKLVDFILSYYSVFKIPPSKLEKILIKGCNFFEYGNISSTSFIKLLKPIKEFKFPIYKGWLLPPQTFSIIPTGEGCLYKCNFCVASLFGGKLFYRSVKYVVKEIENIKRTLGIRIFYLNASSISHNKEWLKNFCREIIKRKLRILWQGYFNICQLHDEKFVKLLRKAGLFKVSLGIESGSDRVLRLMNKPQKVFFIKKVVKILKKYGIIITASFIKGYPGETVEDYISTLRLARELKLDFFGIKNYIPIVGTKGYYDSIYKNYSIKELFKFLCDKEKFSSIHLSYKNRKKIGVILKRPDFLFMKLLETLEYKIKSRKNLIYIA